MANNIEEVRQALCNVRRAHRIVYAYQKRMMDIARFISHKFDFGNVEGYKHFSNTAPKRIYSGTWAWDYIYTYLLEYYFGVKEEPSKNAEYALSLIQYSDTGCFDAEKSTRQNLSTFAPEEEAISKFLFILEVKPKERPLWWKIHEIINNKEYASRHHSSTILKEGDSSIVLYSVPVERFLDENSALDVLKEFCDFCRNKGIIDLALH